MAKRKKEEEHENLERWLVSYGDFITLLFATFVVLYALSQIDVAGFQALEQSMQNAFSAPSLIQGEEGLMDKSGDSILDGGAPESSSMVPPILDYLGAKYEQTSFNEIENSIKKLSTEGELQDVAVEITQRGLVIKLKDNDLYFDSGSANLKPKAKKNLNAISKILKSKFTGHLIRVEGHTDNIPIKSSIYPSNWELSSARSSSVVRYLIENNNLKKGLFGAVGYADSKPIGNNNTNIGRKENRRVELIVLRNRFIKTEPITDTKELVSSIKEEVAPKKTPEAPPVPIIKNQDSGKISRAAKELAKTTGQPTQNIISLKDEYSKESQQIEKEIKENEAKYGYKSPENKNIKPINSYAPKKEINNVKKELQPVVNDDKKIIEKIYKETTTPLKL